MTDRPLSTPGRRPYGYRPGEADILAEMVRMRTEERCTWQEIADALNASGVPSPSGGVWQQASVARIVTRHLRGG